MITDTLIDLALAAGEIASGANPALITARNRCAVILAATPIETDRQPGLPWMQSEDGFLRQNLGVLTESQIAAALGRTVVAVHLRWSRDLGLPSPSKDPRFITARGIARLLGVDEHKPCRWIDTGLLPGRLMPSDANHPRVIRLVERTAFYRWAANPRNWIWFDIDLVVDPSLRNFLQRRRQRWGDEWWTTPQVAAYHDVEVGDVKRYLQMGKLHGVQAPNYAGRHPQPAWARWRILRSEATRPGLVFKKGRGAGNKLNWSQSADAFILLARAVGLSTNAIAAMTGWRSGRVSYRQMRLISDNQVIPLATQYNLRIWYEGDERLFADWYIYHHRFPALAQAMLDFKLYLAGRLVYPRRRKGHALQYVRGVLAAWAAWFVATPEQEAFAGRLAASSHAEPETLAAAYRELCSWGVDPLGALPKWGSL